MLRDIRGFFLAWFAASAILLLFFWMAPASSTRLFIPTTEEDLIRYGDDANFYSYKHPRWSLLLFCLTYLYLQSFCLPGTFLMNLLSGVLYGSFYGSLMSIWLTTVGSSFCYLLSFRFGQELVLSQMSDQLEEFENKVKDNRRRKILLLLSARIFPFTPHWLINLCSPFAGISLWLHAATVAAGLFPYNVLCVRGASEIFHKRSWEVILNPTTLLNLLIIALLLLIVGCVKRNQPELPHHRKPN